MFYRRLFNFPTWGLRSPFDEWAQMRRRMDRLFEGVMAPYQRAQAGVFPLINLTEDRTNYYVRAELPGVKAGELDIQATANGLAISGERKIAAAAEGARYHRREREAGKFSRMIGLPGEIDPDKVEAKLENGILTVVVSKAEAARPRQIAVKS
ncbi:MAG: Hsp20/alpha crystallin family protein [Desulfobacterales bacterium]|nr:MAG: Hsp20/alpha crystallin family protein [Desulfobacterales bacterium]